MLLPLLAMARLESRYSDFSIQSFFFSICLFMERRGKKFLRFMSPTHCFLHLSLDFFSFSLWLRPSCVTSYPYSVSISGWPYYISSVIPLTLPLPKYQLVLAYPLSQPRLVFSPVFMQNDPPPPPPNNSFLYPTPLTHQNRLFPQLQLPIPPPPPPVSLLALLFPTPTPFRTALPLFLMVCH